VHRYPYRSAIRIGTGLAAAALALVTWLPGAAAASTGWHVVFQAHYGAPALANGLFDVTASGRAGAWAVGGTDLSNSTPGAPVAEQWNGTSWQTAALPSGLTGDLVAVSAPAPNDAWAVSQLTGYALHWNGTSWSVARTWPEHQLATQITDVTAFSPTNVWVFGGPGAFPGIGTWHLIGTTWHHVTGLATGVTFVSALSRSDMWAIGDNVAPEDILLHYSAGTWQQLSSPVLNGLNFTRILALSDTNVWVIGSPGAFPGIGTWHLRGTTWHKVTGLAGAISTASAISRSDMWAIGADSVSPDDILLHYNGTTWQQLTGTALAGLQFERILALSDTDVWVTAAPGGGPNQQLLHFDGTQWSSVPITVPSGVQLESITSDGNGGLWFSGFGSSPAQWAVHRSATGTWSSTDLGSGRTVFDLALIPGTTSLWGAGTLAAAPGSDAAIWGHGPATGG
jgi:hypothetical protein